LESTQDCGGWGGIKGGGRDEKRTGQDFLGNKKGTKSGWMNTRHRKRDNRRVFGKGKKKKERWKNRGQKVHGTSGNKRHLKKRGKKNSGGTQGCKKRNTTVVLKKTKKTEGMRGGKGWN